MSHDSDGIENSCNPGSVFPHQLNGEIGVNMEKYNTTRGMPSPLPVVYGDTSNPLRDELFKQRTGCSLGLCGAAGCVVFGIASIILTILFFALGWE